MNPFLLRLFEQLGIAAFQRWLGTPKPTARTEDDHALERKEAENLAKPSGEWDDTVDGL